MSRTSRGDCAPPISLAHCGRTMADVTTVYDLELDRWTYECTVCGWQVRVSEEADDDEPAEPASARTPTDATPGSERKVAVMAARLAAGETLYHPADNTVVAVADARPDCAAVRELPRGVSRARAGKRRDRVAEGYEARATVGGRRVYLGRFARLAVARRAVELAEAGDVEGARALADGRR